MLRLPCFLLILTLSACAMSAASKVPDARPLQPEAAKGEPRPADMFVVQADLTISVEKLPEATTRLRTMAVTFGAQLANDEVVSKDGLTHGRFDIRVPAEQVQRFLEALVELGKPLSRTVLATEVSKAYHDSGLLLQNLRLTLTRYEELLAKATDVKDMLSIEAELGRVRGEIDRVEGERRWTEDCVARASVHVDLVTQQSELGEPEAKFYLGITGQDFTSLGAHSVSRLGGGLSFFFGGHFTLEFDVGRKAGTGSVFEGADLFLATFSGAVFSDFLGGGRRTFLNPYVGFRFGYARIDAANEAVVGLELGLELIRFKYVMIDARVACLGLLGGPSGLGVAVQPVIAARIAF